MAASAASIQPMPGLLSEGLRVRHIANMSLMTCEVTDDDEEVLRRPALADFEQIPIVANNHVVEILERKPQRRRPLDGSVLVSADELLLGFIFTLKVQRYRLVVDGTSISGIVTWSDLQKAPVLMLGYAMVAEVELMMNRAIWAMYGDSDDWLQMLDENERHMINGLKVRLERDDIVLPTIELADFVHKAKVIRTRYLAEFDFDGDIEKLRKLRNDVAHVRPVVQSDADLHDFVGRLETAKEWAGVLSAAGFASM